jgi:phage repressor protein C with HTH and peptisase S24 domain
VRSLTVRLSVPRIGRVLVRGRSMEPTLRDGDHLLVQWGGRPEVGRLVVVRWPGRPMSVKRAALHDAQGWWVERDNPVEGVDSWQAGPVPDEDVLATVVGRVWPVRRRRPAR